MENVGRAMTDIQRMNGTFEGPEAENDQAVLTGSAPVSEMRGYQKEFAAYTGGFGRLFCTLKGYDVCHDAENVVGEISYDPDSCRLVGQIVNVSADESVLGEDGKIDPEKLRPITFDPVHHTYRTLGPVAGNAFRDGAKLK